jgi:hypothetical protein
MNSVCPISSVILSIMSSIVLSSTAGCTSSSSSPEDGDCSAGKCDFTETLLLDGDIPGDRIELSPDLGTRTIVEVSIDPGEFAPIDGLTFSLYFANKDGETPQDGSATARMYVKRGPGVSETDHDWKSDDKDTSWVQQFKPDVPAPGEYSILVVPIEDRFPVIVDVRADSALWRARSTVDLAELEPNDVDVSHGEDLSWRTHCQRLDLSDRPPSEDYFRFRGEIDSVDDIDCYFIERRSPDVIAELEQANDELEFVNCQRTAAGCETGVGVPHKRHSLSSISNPRYSLLVRSRDGGTGPYSLRLDELPVGSD